MLHLQKTALKVARKKDSMTKKAYKSGVKYPMQHEDCLRDLKSNYLVSDPTCSAGAAGFHWPGCRCWEYLDSVGSPSNLQNTQPYGQLLPPTYVLVLSIKQNSYCHHPHCQWFWIIESFWMNASSLLPTSVKKSIMTGITIDFH